MTVHQCRVVSLPLAVFFLVGSTVLAARAEDVHDLGYEAGKHRLRSTAASAAVFEQLSLVKTVLWSI